MPSSLAMIPARMGSQRLTKKNLRELDGVPLLTRVIRKCKVSNVFDEIWVNSEHPAFGEIASAEGVQFHQRPQYLGGHDATSEEYVAEFLETHICDYLFQVHSVAPLLTVSGVQEFVKEMVASDFDVLLGVEAIPIECVYKGKPVNFSFNAKTNSQDLTPVERISWSITGWRRDTYIEAVRHGACATYAGKVGYHRLSRFAAHVIKTEEDLRLAEALLPFVMEGDDR